MATAVLSDTKIKNAKLATQGRTYKLTDGGGLFVRVTSTAKLWQYKYRLGGKEHSYSIGPYPAITLQRAREEHAKARVLVQAGEHPKQRRELEKLEKLHAGADTVAGIAEEWISTAGADWTDYYRRQVRRALDSDVLPTLGKFPVRQVTTLLVRDVLSTIKSRGVGVTVNNAQGVMSRIFRFAIQHGRADTDPAAALKGLYKRPPVKHNTALAPDGIRELMLRLRHDGGFRATRIALELMLHTFVRTVELRAAKWSEFKLEPDQSGGPEWRIPASRMKMGVEHIVPLSKQVVALLRELRQVSGSNQWLFPNHRRPDDCMTATTLNRALERMGFAGAGGKEFSAHGFRGTASTLLHERNYPSDVIERQLAHAERNKVKASYNKAQYMDQRIDMMQHWSNYLESLAVETKLSLDAAG